jgi:hypothetical protein
MEPRPQRDHSRPLLVAVEPIVVHDRPIANVHAAPVIGHERELVQRIVRHTDVPAELYRITRGALVALAPRRQ